MQEERIMRQLERTEKELKRSIAGWAIISIVIISTVIISGCDTDNMELQRIFIESTHSHLVEIDHSHDFSESEHKHTVQEFFPERGVRQPTELTTENPFIDMLILTEQVLALEGGTDLLRIALKPRTTEAQKIALAMRLPNSEARRLLIAAYLGNEDRVERLQAQIEAAKTGQTTKTTQPAKAGQIEGTNIDTTN